MSLNDAKVTLTLGEVNKLQHDKAAAELRVAELEKKAADAKLGDPDSIARLYRAAFEDSMTVVRFAIGSLDPLSVRGWPYKSLFEISTHLKNLPGIEGDAADTANDIKIFAQEAERWELARERGEEKSLFQEDNASRGPVVPQQ